MKEKYPLFRPIYLNRSDETILNPQPRLFAGSEVLIIGPQIEHIPQIHVTLQEYVSSCIVHLLPNRLDDISLLQYFERVGSSQNHIVHLDT